jgi:hypothetical protein
MRVGINGDAGCRGASRCARAVIEYVDVAVASAGLSRPASDDVGQ